MKNKSLKSKSVSKTESKKTTTKSFVIDNLNSIANSILLYKEIIDVSPIGTAIYNSSGKCIMANEALSKISGGTISQLEKQNFKKLKSWEKSGMRDAAQKALDTSIPQTLECQTESSFKNLFWIRAKFNSFIHNDEKYLLVNITDISDSIKFELKLSTQLEHYKILMKTSQDLIHIVDKKGNLIECNDAFLKHLGYTKKETAKLKVTDWDRKWNQKDVEKIINSADEKGITFETLHKCKNGKIKNVSVLCRKFHIDGKDLYYSSARDITERKINEQILRKSEEKYRSLFENMHEGFAYCKMLFENDKAVDFIYTDVNEQFGKLTGLKNVVGKKVTDVIPGIRKDDDELFQIYEKVVTKRVSRKFEYYLHTLNIWFLISVYSPQKDYFVATFEVITERKNAELKLRESEQRFRLLIENGNDMIAMVDEDSNIIYLSPSIQKQMGWDKVSETTKRWIDYLHHDDVKIQVKTIEKAILNPTIPYTLELQLRKNDGSYIWVDSTFTNYLKLDSVNAIVINFRNITERKNYENKIVESESNIRSIFDNTHTGFILFDKNLNIKIVNPQGQYFSRIEFGELLIVGKNIKEYASKINLKNTLQTIDDVLKGAVLKLEHQYTGVSGIPNWYHIRFFPIFDNLKNVSGIILAISDINERKVMEQQLKESEENLKRGELVAKYGYWELNMENKMMYSSNGAKKIYGTDKELMTLKEITSFRLSEYNEYMDIALKNLIQNNIPYDIEFKIKRPNDGKIIDIHSRAEYDAKTHTIFGTIQDITEHKEYEKALLESKKEYSDLVEQIPVIVFKVRKKINGEITLDYLSPNVISRLDRKDNFESFRFIDIIYLDTKRKEYENKMIESEQSLQTFTWEGQIKIKDYIFWGFVESTPKLLQNGDIVWNGIGQDISERKKSEEEHKVIIETSLDGFYIVDKAGKILEVNNSYCSMIGFSRDELLKMYVKDVEVFDSEEKIKIDIQRIIESSGSDFFEGNHKCKDGRIINIEAAVNSIKNSENVFVFVRDITERKNAEKQLLQLSQVVEQSPATIVITDIDGNIEYVNPMFSKTTGYSLEEAIGKNPRILKSGDKPNEEYKQLWDTITSGKTWLGEFQNKKKNGELYWESAIITPIINDKGNMKNYLAVKTEITDQKANEIIRKKITDDLIQRNKDLEQFTYIVSHNLRAPVANIIGFNDVLKSVELDENSKNEMLDGINISVQKLDSVIQDLNNILQVRQNITEKKEVINFSNLVNDIKYSLGIKIGNKDVIIKTDFTELSEIESLPSYVNSIFYNLISNSLKYRKPNENPVITIKSNKLLNGFQLSFKDNGLGIDMNKDGDKLFTLYKRFHTKYAEGKGVGLFMVKTQIESLGGKVEVKSELNEGTEFILTFEN